MTCREKLKIEHPEYVNEIWAGGCFRCPSDYEYLPKPDYCANTDRCYEDDCERCWDREIPEDREEMKDENPHILDSGARRKFESGAVRDIQEGKGRCDLLPLDVVSVICDEGESDHAIIDHIYKFQNDGGVGHLFGALDHFAVRYFEAATMGGACCTMALEVSIHFEEGAKKYGENNWQKGIPVHCYIDSAVRHYLKFMRGDKDEPHDRAFCWNLMCAIWTCKHKPELNDYAKRDTSAVKEMMD